MSRNRQRYPSKSTKPKSKASDRSYRDYVFNSNGTDNDERRQKRSWSYHDLASIKPLTRAQEAMYRKFAEGRHLVAYGSAGTGKTFVGLYLALNEILFPKSPTNTIVIVRSAVQSREIGFTPGTFEEKIALYENPYKDILCEIVGRPSTYDDMKREGLIHFTITSFIRGLTYSNAIVIIDEIQNFSFGEIHSVITRLGENSRLIALGDVSQNDLLTKRNEVSGMSRFLQVANKMPDVSMIEFTRDDIVRSQIVRDWIVACEETD